LKSLRRIELKIIRAEKKKKKHIKGRNKENRKKKKYKRRGEKERKSGMNNKIEKRKDLK